MQLEIVEESPDQLAEYARVPIAFVVREAFDEAAIERLERGEDAAPTPIRVPYLKDYDAEFENHPTAWPRRFDMSGWVVLAAHAGGRRVGGAVLAMNDSELDLFRGNEGAAVLWDLRVAQDDRRCGVGGELLSAAERFAIKAGAHRLIVETQPINVPACRFYLRHGFSVESVNHHAYPSLPDEVQLIWAKTLSSD